MSTEENKELVRRFFDERWNHGNFDVYDEMLAPGLDIKGAKNGHVPSTPLSATCGSRS